MRSLLRRLPVPIALVALWSCNRRPLVDSCEHPINYTSQRSSIATSRPVDILFVIDNSNSMDEEQSLLNDQFDRLIRKLDRDVTGGFPNAHVGIVATDLGSDPSAAGACDDSGVGGRLRHDATVDFAYVEINRTVSGIAGNIENLDTPTEDGTACQDLADADGRPVAAEGDLALDLCDIQEAFRRNARLGAGGSQLEQPLEAARLALIRNETLAGQCAGETESGDTFLRPGSVLAVVFLTDEDDCSALPESSFWANPDEFGCLEHGVTCQEPIDRAVDQTLTCCRSNETSAQLHPVERYVEFLSSLRERGHTVVLAAISGPFSSAYAGGPDDDPCSGDLVTTTVRRAEREVAYSCDIADSPDGGVPDGGTPDGGAPDAGAADGGTTGQRRTAEPAIRIGETIRRFARSFGPQSGVVLSDLPENEGVGICTDDFSPALELLATQISLELNSYCLSQPLIDSGGARIADASDALCDVVERRDDGEEIPLEPCAFVAAPEMCPGRDESPGVLTGPAPCWYLCRGSCPNEWQMAYCGNESCSPQPAELLLQCLTEPGDECL
jgi:hypothetical protein